jgi:hypothetical protein
MTKSNLSKEAVFVAIAQAGLLNVNDNPTPTKFLELYENFAEHCRGGKAPVTFWEALVIEPTTTQALCDWTEESFAEWGLVVLMCDVAIRACGLRDKTVLMLELLSGHPLVYNNPVICTLFAALAEAYDVRIVPRVYAKGVAHLAA